MQESMTLFSLFMRQSKRGELTGDLRRLRHAMTRCWETTRSARLLSLPTFHCRCQRRCRPAHTSIEHRTIEKNENSNFCAPSFRQPPHNNRTLKSEALNRLLLKKVLESWWWNQQLVDSTPLPDPCQLPLGPRAIVGI